MTPLVNRVMLLIKPLRRPGHRRRRMQRCRVRSTCARVVPLPRCAAAAGSLCCRRWLTCAAAVSLCAAAVAPSPSPPPSLQERGDFLRVGFPVFWPPPRRSVTVTAVGPGARRRLQPRLSPLMASTYHLVVPINVYRVVDIFASTPPDAPIQAPRTVTVQGPPSTWSV